MKRVVAILLALPPLAYSMVALFSGWLAWGMQCDEVCDPSSSDWRYTSGAWQWSAIGALGVVAFLAGIFFVAAVITRRQGLALVCLGAGTAVVAVALWKFTVNPASDQELDLQAAFWLVSAAVLASGVIAAVLSGASNASASRSELRLVARRVFAGLAFLAGAYFLLGGVSVLFGSTVGVSGASYFGKAAILGLVGWGFWRGGFAPKGRTG